MNMSHYGATPTPKCATPSATPIAWSAFLIADPAVRVRVEAQHWGIARELGAPLLGTPFVEQVDAEVAVEA